MQLLVTGATGKVGQAFLDRFLDEPRWKGARVVALCNNRTIPETDRVKVVRGSMSDPETVARAMAGTTHVLHMAAVKEDPVHAMDVAVKGMFLLLEAFRANKDGKQFILIGGDCSVGHCFVEYNGPVTEDSPRRGYPGVYALTKILEEVMLEQAGIQYGVNWTTLRAPWIMEKDDFKFALSFGPNQFGGPDWDALISPALRKEYAATNAAPLLIAADGKPLKRNFVHLDDLVEAIVSAIDHPATKRQLFNIAMTEAVDYEVVGAHLHRTRGMRPVRIETPYISNLLDNGKARLRLGWTPKVDTVALCDRAFAYERAAGDERKIWYPG
ncbi:MAG: NAD(P)-dependent oxidoreductase [Devosia sp.]